MLKVVSGRPNGEELRRLALATTTKDCMRLDEPTLVITGNHRMVWVGIDL